MKKIIILIAILCCIGFCKLDYNKAIEHLGGNCRVENDEINKNYFFCDSGFINFDFIKEEIFLSYETISNKGRKEKIVISFNRGWNKKGKQIHKENSYLLFISDEFNTVVFSIEGKWSGDGGDFYERFKENVYYGKRNVKPKKKEPLADVGRVYPSVSEPKPTYAEQRIAQIMEKYK